VPPAELDSEPAGLVLVATAAGGRRGSAGGGNAAVLIERSGPHARMGRRVRREPPSSASLRRRLPSYFESHGPAGSIRNSQRKRAFGLVIVTTGEGSLILFFACVDAIAHASLDSVHRGRDRPGFRS